MAIKVIVQLMGQQPKVVNGSTLKISGDGVSIFDMNGKLRLFFAHNMGEVNSIDVNVTPLNDTQEKSNVHVCSSKIGFDDFMKDLFKHFGADKEG